MSRVSCTFVRFLLLLACSWCGAAYGANLQISPVMINFRADQPAAGINLQNLGDGPAYGQVRVYAWDQQGGEDTLTPTQEVVASPPIVQIGPKGSQTIRLVRTAAAPAGAERTYRVLFDEIARDDGPATGVDIRLRYSVPVFIMAAGDRPPEALSWAVFRKDGEWMMRVSNTGQRHAQIGAMSISNGAGKDFVISKGLFGYVLAGRTREWRLPVTRESELDGPLAIKAYVNAKLLAANSAAAQ